MDSRPPARTPLQRHSPGLGSASAWHEDRAHTAGCSFQEETEVEAPESTVPSGPCPAPPWAPKGPAQGAGRGQATHVQTGLLRARQARELPPPRPVALSQPLPGGQHGNSTEGHGPGLV